MFALSYLTLLREQFHAARTRRHDDTRLHAANLAMCAGQAYDIGFEWARAVIDGRLPGDDRGETAVLFGAACSLGALSADADEHRAAAYGELGRV